MRAVHAVAAVVGLVGVWAVYETGEHGGKLVYAYAGGVGLRSGDPKDVERLLLAGYYQPAMADRAAGRSDQAAQLIDALNAAQLPADNRFMAFRKAGLLADAYDAMGRKPEAAAALEAVLKVFPNGRLQQRLDALRK